MAAAVKQTAKMVDGESLAMDGCEEVVQGILQALESCVGKLQQPEDAVSLSIQWEKIRCQPDAKPAFLSSVLRQHISDLQPLLDKLQTLTSGPEGKKADLQHPRESPCVTGVVAKESVNAGNVSTKLVLNKSADPAVVQIQAGKSEDSQADRNMERHFPEVENDVSDEDYDRDLMYDESPDEDTESSLSDTSSESDLDNDREEDPELQALLLELRKKAEAACPDNTPSFQHDPRWESLEAIPLNPNLVNLRIGNTLWCTCGNCGPMPTRDQSCCCQEDPALNCHFDNGLQCILEILTNGEFTEQSLIRFVDYAAREPTMELNKFRNKVLRTAAYRQFSLFAHGRLGPKNRVPIPACVVKFVRKRFPDPDGAYVGYFCEQESTASEMAHDA